MLNCAACSLLLSVGLEEELVDLADGQALSQVIKGAVFVATMMAMATGLATPGEALDQGGAQGVRADLELGEQESLTLAQSQSGFAGIMNPSHM